MKKYGISTSYGPQFPFKKKHHMDLNLNIMMTWNIYIKKKKILIDLHVFSFVHEKGKLNHIIFK